MSIGISFDQWNQQDLTGDSHRVVLACGPEDQLREEMVDRFESHLPDDCEHLTLYADELEPDEALRELRSPGLFSGQKFVRLRNLDRSEGGTRRLKTYLDALTDYAEDPEPGVMLMLEDGDHPYKGGRSVGTLARAIESAGGTVVICWELFDRTMQARLREKLDEMGVVYDPAVVPAIIERVEGKYARALQELKKLNPDTDRITVEDVETLVSREPASETLQEFKNGLFSDPLPRVLERLDDLYRENTSPPRIAYVLVQHLQTLRTVQKKLRKGNSLEEVLNEHGIPTSQGITKQYRADLKNMRHPFPGDFFRRSYRLIRQSRYGTGGVEQRSLESYLIRMLPRLRTR